MILKEPTRAPDADPDSFETLLLDVSTRFINVRPDEVDAAVEDVQRRLCEMLGIDLSALWEEVTEQPGDFVLTHFYGAREDLLPPMRGMSAREHFPWLRSEMMAGRAVAASNLDDLPEAAAFDRDNLRRFGVHSNLTLPLSVGAGPVVAALGFNTTRAIRDWPDVLVQRLQLVGQVFANALARKRADTALRESEARSRLAADSAEAGLWTYDYRTRTFWVSDRTRAMFGYLPDEPMDIERLERSVIEDDWPGVANAIEEAARSGEIVNVDYRVLFPGGDGVRWMSSRGRAHFSATGEATRLMGVSVDVTDKKRTDEAIATYRRFEALLIDVSAELIDVSPEELDREIEEALGRVCGILGLDLAVVWQRSADATGLLAPTHSYPPLAAVASAGALSRDSYPWVVGQVLEGRTVAVWGLAFKPKTDDMREAPAITVIEKLLEAGAVVRAYDPEATKIAKAIFGTRVTFAKRSYDALVGAEALALVTEWNEFREPDFAKMRKLMSSPVVFDGRNIYNREQMKADGFIYYSIGR
jgi:PAS domain S-box-containing protein